MDKLQEIMAAKRKEISARVRPVRSSELQQLRRPDSAKSFLSALNRSEGLAVISEVKRKSPSAGNIAVSINAADQARKYYNAGADAISVLTDEQFLGTIRDLWEINDLLANRADTPPTLRKDFFVHPIQVVEAAEAGAACILIIVRALSDDEMKALFEAANLANLDSIFEVHAEDEVERALAIGSKIVGVNNRDLSRFVTDLAISESIIPNLPEEVTAISESGIWTIEDAIRAWETGANAVLVGEALMKMDDPEPFIQECHMLS